MTGFLHAQPLLLREVHRARIAAKMPRFINIRQQSFGAETNAGSQQGRLENQHLGLKNTQAN